MAMPPVPGRFCNDAAARIHLRDHVLSRPETGDWALVIPEYRGLVDPNDDDALDRIARSLVEAPMLDAGRDLLDAYQRELRHAIEDAVERGWWWQEEDEEGPSWHGLGVSGIFVLWTSRWFLTGYSLRSGRLPGFGAGREDVLRPRNDAHARPVRVPTDRTGARHKMYESCCELFVSRRYADAYYEGRVVAVGDAATFGNFERPLRRTRWSELYRQLRGVEP